MRRMLQGEAEDPAPRSAPEPDPEPSEPEPLWEHALAEAALADPEDLGAQAVWADWLEEQGNTIGGVVNAELMGSDGLDLMRRYASHVPFLLGSLDGVIEPVVIEYGRIVEARVLKLPTDDQRRTLQWRSLRRLHAGEFWEQLEKWLPTNRSARLAPEHMIPVALLSSGKDRLLHLGFDRGAQEPVVFAVGIGNQPVSPRDADALPILRRAVGVEIYPAELEPLPPLPWTAELRAQVIGAAPERAAAGLEHQMFVLHGEVVRIGEPECRHDWQDQERRRRWGLMGTRWAGAQARGLVRMLDEDTFGGSDHTVFVVDAQGGMESGDRCAALVAGALQAAPSIARGLEAAEAALAAGDGYSGCALAAAELEAGSARITGVGDCRVYRLREGVLEQISQDHTLIQQMLDQGRVTPEEAVTHPHRNILLRALTPDGVEPESRTIDWTPGDRLLLCSDGLHNTLDDSEIQALLTGTPAEAVRRLIYAAEPRSADNISLVVIDETSGKTDSK